MLYLVRERCNRFSLPSNPRPSPELVLHFTVFPYTISFHPILSLPRPRSLYFLPPLCLAVLNSSSQCCPVIPTGWTFGTSESDSMSMNGESRAGRWCDFRPCAHPPNAPIMPSFSPLHLFPLPFTANKAKSGRHGTHWEPINMPAGRVWLRAFVCVSMRTWGQAHQCGNESVQRECVFCECQHKDKAAAVQERWSLSVFVCLLLPKRDR